MDAVFLVARRALELKVPSSGGQCLRNVYLVEDRLAN
jgi:hypothetical protein